MLHHGRAPLAGRKEEEQSEEDEDDDWEKLENAEVRFVSHLYYWYPTFKGEKMLLSIDILKR